MCVCTYVYMYVCMYSTYMYLYVHVYSTHMYLYVHVYIVYYIFNVLTDKSSLLSSSSKPNVTIESKKSISFTCIYINYNRHSINI